MEAPTPAVTTTTPTPAAPPPVAAPAPAEPKTGSEILSGLSATERAEWRRTGTLPEPKPTETNAAPSPAAPAEPAAEIAATPGSEKPPTPPSEAATPSKEKGAEARIKELLAKNKELEARLAAPPPVQALPAAPPPAQAADPEPDATDYEKYPLGTADPKYIRDLSAHIAKGMLAEHRAQQAKAETETRQRAEHARASAELAERTTSIKEKHADFEEVARGVKGIAPGSPLDAFILGSKRYGFEALYHLGKHPDELARIMAIPDVIEQVEELVLLGHALTSATPAPKTETTAPPPPKTLGTRATNVADPAEAALARGDFGEYRRLTNERDLARKK